MRYTVTEKEPLHTGTRVFEVARTTPNGYGFFDHVDVWVQNTKPQCCQCSGPLQAMLSTCPHANAVKRYLTKMGDK